MNNLSACYRGCTNVWECDEMGHMNVRFYVSKAEQGLGVFAGQLGITPDWLRNHGLELAILDQHIRFIREYQGGADLIIYAGVLEASKDSLRIYQEFRAPDSDVIAGTLISLVEIRHVESQAMRPIPSFALKTGETLKCSIPDKAKPRSIPLEGPLPGGTRSRAEELGLTPISIGQVLATEADCYGNFLTHSFMGRISDGIGTIMKGFRKELAAVQTSSDMQLGGAALEYRLIYHKRPRVGDLIGVYACLSKVTSKIFVLNHWTVDLATGEPLCSSEDVAVSLDLVARKAVSVPPEFQAVYQSHVIADLEQEVV